MDLKTYKQTFDADDSPGWTAIDEGLRGIYPEVEPDFHFGTIISYALGGPDPLDGVSVYKRTGSSPHLHYVSYGMSELYYNEEAVGGQVSGWGFEFTFRLKMSEANMPLSDDGVPIWPINLMQNLGRYVFQSRQWFEDGHFIPANGPIHAEADTAMVALLMVKDPELGSIETPHGPIDFLQLVGLTQEEFDLLRHKKSSAKEMTSALSNGNRLLLTDLDRRQSVL
ncbi:MAG: suppressor of fused domain protein [Pseudomonadota bacterium]